MPIDLSINPETGKEKGYKVHVRGKANNPKDVSTFIIEQEQKGKRKWFDWAGQKEISNAQNWERDNRGIGFCMSVGDYAGICSLCKSVLRAGIEHDCVPVEILEGKVNSSGDR